MVFKRVMHVQSAFGIALLFFSISALLGLLMRMAFSIDLPEWISYTHLRRTHSNAAMLGWLFSAFLIVTIQVFKLNWNAFSKIYILLQVVLAFASLSLLISGNSTSSKILLTFHLIITYVIIFRLFTALKKESHFDVVFLKTALAFFLLASLGNIALIPIAKMGLTGTVWYYGAIQFYLHFVFNGFFLFILFAILFRLLNNRFTLPQSLLKSFYGLQLLATILTFALAITWSNPKPIIFYINSAGVGLQFIALVVLLCLLSKLNWKEFKSIPTYVALLLKFSFAFYILKVLIQTAVVIPYIASISYTIKNFVIGFFHLMMLGCFSTFILGVVGIYYPKWIQKQGVYVFILGILITEILLFVQGLEIWLQLGFLPYYYEMISFASLILALGIWMINLNYFKSINFRKSMFPRK